MDINSATQLNPGLGYSTNLKDLLVPNVKLAGEETNAVEALVKGPKKPIKKSRHTSAKTTIKGNSDTEGSEIEDNANTADSASLKKRKASAKNALDIKGGEIDNEAASKFGNSSAEKNTLAQVTPKKRAITDSVSTPRKRTGGNEFPKSVSDFSEADHLIVNMKNEQKDWKEIERKWEELTGKKPGKDVLRKKYAKLSAIAIEFTHDDCSKLCELYKKVDHEIVTQIKNLESDRWVKTAKLMQELGSQNYKAAQIREKFAALEKDGRINQDGDYILPAGHLPPVNPVTDSADGTTNGSEAQVNLDASDTGADPNEEEA